MRGDSQIAAQPEVAATGRALGVRPSDIPVDQAGNVNPQTGGMSVSPTWRELPGFRIPKRLRPLCNKAAGPDDNHCWTMGNGLFQASTFTADLNLRPDPQNSAHGFIEPSQKMNIVNYAQSLANTLGAWRKDEV